MKKSNDQGMQTFDHALFEMLQDGAITIEEAMRNADSVNDLRLKIKLSDGDTSMVDSVIADSMSLEDTDDDEDKQQGMIG